MNIKEAEKLSGVSVRNIRFYEEKGLLAPARNKDNDYREYTDADVRQLMLIRALRMVDMPLEKIREVVEGQVPLHDAATAQKEKLDEKIEQLKVATKFCAELAETKPEDVKEVLERMDQPENRKELFNKWKEDHRQTFVKLGLSFGAGILFPIISYYTIFVLFFAGVFLELFGIGQREGAMLLVYLAPLLLWSYTAYKLYEKKWWLLEAILAHLCLAALVFLPDGMALYSLKYSVLMPAQPFLSLLRYLGVEELRDTSSLYAMEISFWIISAFYCLGILIAMVKAVISRIKRKRTSRWAQFSGKHPRRVKAIKAFVLVCLIVFVGSVKQFDSLLPDQDAQPKNEWVDHYVSTALNLEVWWDEGECSPFRASNAFASVISADQWERANTGRGKGEEVVAINIGYVEKYLTFYENDIVRVYNGENPWGFARYVYYTMPDGTAEAALEYIYDHFV